VITPYRPSREQTEPHQADPRMNTRVAAVLMLQGGLPCQPK